MFKNSKRTLIKRRVDGKKKRKGGKMGKKEEKKGRAQKTSRVSKFIAEKR